MTKNPNTERALRLGNNKPPGRPFTGVPRPWKSLPNAEHNICQPALSNKSFLTISIILILIGVGGYLMFGRKKNK